MNSEEEAPSARCPRCGSTNVKRIALYGSQLMTSQYKCMDCRQLFEAIRWQADSSTSSHERERRTPGSTDIKPY